MVNATSIFHITHINNLPGIVEDGCLWSDRRLIGAHGERVTIGHSKIKKQRMEERFVHCHPGKMVGDFVPFYFCPRSPMLYVIHMRNSELSYHDGQEPVVHLVSSVQTAIDSTPGQRWAFSDHNAASHYAQFCSDISLLPTFVNWPAVKATWWKGVNVDPAVMSKKMAEFLVEDCFPWTSIIKIGVISKQMAVEVAQAIKHAEHQPTIAVEPNWYY